jgi:hypothetical protein
MIAASGAGETEIYHRDRCEGREAKSGRVFLAM